MNEDLRPAGEQRQVVDWKTAILPAYEVRKRKKQKDAFIGMLEGHFGDRMRVETCGSVVKSRNIVIGDPEKADVIYTAHYDTCAGLPFPNFITPKSIPLYLLYQIVIAVGMVIPIFGLTLLVGWLCRGLPDLPGLLLTEGALLLGLFGMFWLFMGDHPNPHTANDNTSGVVTVLTLADRLLDREGEGIRAAFILFDNEENGLLGSMGYAAAHPEQRDRAFVVNFDCVSDGGHFLILFSKPAEKLPYYAALKSEAEAVFAGSDRICEIIPKKGTIYPSDQASFKVSAAICAMNVSKRGILYMDKIHTVKDTVFDGGNIGRVRTVPSSVSSSVTETASGSSTIARAISASRSAMSMSR